ncbi:hypothetical protein F5884DRAFT_786079 [Xylogone sp. PMI_703]|nr:hypothetical protein F5884DRAFT_786079 [Xylogone sp. PMI_703]
MSIYWTYPDGDEPFAKHKLSQLIKFIVDAEDPIPGIRETIELVRLLILSNHLDKANEILCAIYNITDNATNPSLQPGLELEVFWHTNKGFRRPEKLPACPGDFGDRLKSARWGKYRECTRTG